MVAGRWGSDVGGHCRHCGAKTRGWQACGGAPPGGMAVSPYRLMASWPHLIGKNLQPASAGRWASAAKSPARGVASFALLSAAQARHSLPARAVATTPGLFSTNPNTWTSRQTARSETCGATTNRAPQRSRYAAPTDPASDAAGYRLARLDEQAGPVLQQSQQRADCNVPGGSSARLFTANGLRSSAAPGVSPS